MSTISNINWMDLSSTSNRHIQTYIRGFLDISCGNILSGGSYPNALVIRNGDASLNGNVVVGGFTNFNGPININSNMVVKSGSTISFPSNSIFGSVISNNTITGSQISNAATISGIQIAYGSISASQITNNSVFVDLTNSQTISGVKTFSNGMVSSGISATGNIALNTASNIVSTSGNINLIPLSSSGNTVYISGNLQVAGMTSLYGNVTVTSTVLQVTEELDISSSSIDTAFKVTQTGITGNIAVFNNSSNTGMIINNNGNVGIGSQSPTAALDVSGAGKFSGLLTATNGFTVNSGTVTFQNNSISGNAIKNNNITGSQISNSATISGIQIASQTISSTNILNNTITGSQISNSATISGIQIAFGSISAAQITFSGTTNYLTKYSSSSAIAASSILYDNGTNIGIGSTVPRAKLDVVGSIMTNTAGGSVVYTTRLINDQGTTLYLQPDVPSGDVIVGYSGTTISNVSTAFRVYGNNPSTYTTTKENFTVLNNGKVGIGSTNPLYALDVSGTILTGTGSVVNTPGFVSSSSSNPQNNIYLFPYLGQGSYNGLSVLGDAGIILTGTSISTQQGGFVIGPWTSAGAVGMRMDKTGNLSINTQTTTSTLNVGGTGYFSGNVGIGTATNYTSLNIGGNGLSILSNIGSQTISSSGSGTFIGWNATSGTAETDFVTFNAGTSGINGGFSFYNSSTTTFSNATTPLLARITGNGNFGIGVGTPSASLHVVGGSLITGDASFNSRLYVNADVSFNGNLQVKGTVMANVFQINTNATLINGQSTVANLSGLVVINDTSLNRLYCSDAINAASFNATSDYRIKANVNPLSNLPDYFTVDNLKPVSYHRKDLSRNEYGFIAHEVQEIYPDIVTGEKDGLGYQHLNYIALIPILVKEIQDLKRKNNLLENRIDKLEKIINK